MRPVTSPDDGRVRQSRRRLGELGLRAAFIIATLGYLATAFKRAAPDGVVVFVTLFVAVWLAVVCIGLAAERKTPMWRVLARGNGNVVVARAPPPFPRPAPRPAPPLRASSEWRRADQRDVQRQREEVRGANVVGMLMRGQVKLHVTVILLLSAALFLLALGALAMFGEWTIGDTVQPAGLSTEVWMSDGSTFDQ